jgi:hypothetical protein
MGELSKKLRVTSVATTEESKKKEVPKGAIITSKTVRTETEQIENGWITSKNYDISYTLKGSNGYAYYSKKWFTKEDPLEIKVTDKSVADAFDEE